MKLSRLSIKELCFLHLTDEMKKKLNPPAQEQYSIHFEELRARVGEDCDTFDQCIKAAKAGNLISNIDHIEILTAIKIRNIELVALEKLHRKK